MCHSTKFENQGPKPKTKGGCLRGPWESLQPWSNKPLLSSHENLGSMTLMVHQTYSQLNWTYDTQNRGFCGSPTKMSRLQDLMWNCQFIFSSREIKSWPHGIVSHNHTSNEVVLAVKWWKVSQPIRAWGNLLEPQFRYPGWFMCHGHAKSIKLGSSDLPKTKVCFSMAKRMDENIKWLLGRSNFVYEYVR